MDQILAYLQEIHPQPWGEVLDAGTGRSSLQWLTQLHCRAWTAVTAETGREEILRCAYRERFRPQDRLLVGNWQDSDFLRGETFSEVVADYLLGSVERYAPYFQVDALARLARLTLSRLYLIGLEPHSTGAGEHELVSEITRFRAACHRLAGHPSHREYPLEWAVARLKELGLEIEEVQRFSTFYGDELIEDELRGLQQILDQVPQATLRWALRARLRELRRVGRRCLTTQGPLPGGFDYLIVARVPGAAADGLSAGA